MGLMDKLLMVWDSGFEALNRQLLMKEAIGENGCSKSLFVVFIVEVKKSGLENKFGC